MIGAGHIDPRFALLYGDDGSWRDTIFTSQRSLRAGGQQGDYLYDLPTSEFCACSASNILAMGHWLKVIGIDTSAIATKMVKWKIVRDRSLCLLIEPSVSDLVFAFSLELPISKYAQWPFPNPTSRFVINAVYERNSAVVSRNTADVFAPNFAFGRAALFRDSGGSSTPAHAQTAWIRWNRWKDDCRRSFATLATTLIDAAPMASLSMVRHIERFNWKRLLTCLAKTDRLKGHEIDLLDRSMDCRAGSVSSAARHFKFPHHYTKFGPQPVRVFVAPAPQPSGLREKVTMLFRVAAALLRGEAA